jgi:methylglutaconyl-CoA hydratase
MSTSSVLAASDERGIATITFNRPDKANSYDYPMIAAVARHAERFAADAKVRAIVIRGAGKHFSAGSDVSVGVEPGDPKDRTIFQILLMLDALPKPTVAVVQGACLGSGFALAACCDIVLGDRSAFFSMPEVRLGFSPGSMAYLFARAVGARNVRRYGMTGQRFSAEDAYRMGLLHELCDDAQALERALAAQLEEVLLAGPNAAASAKKVARKLIGGLPTEAESAELQNDFLRAQGSAEAKEGKASFREKRKPAWYPKG